MENHLKDMAQRMLKKSVETLTASEKNILTRIHRRERVSRDVHADYHAKEKLGDRMADAVARFGGSWTFIMAFVATLALWTLANTFFLGDMAFDIYPFIFLNLLLSMLAAAQAPIIMMAQNRQSSKDRLMAGHDYEVNLKAELEIMSLHEKLDQMRTDQLAAMIASQQEQIRLLTELIERKATP